MTRTPWLLLGAPPEPVPVTEGSSVSPTHHASTLLKILSLLWKTLLATRAEFRLRVLMKPGGSKASGLKLREYTDAR
jgi:hypothetical protein